MCHNNKEVFHCIGDNNIIVVYHPNKCVHGYMHS